jgi:syntaxin 1B/2/3
MVELAQLFQDLDTVVQQQEPLVANIEQKGEEVRDNMTKGNEEIGTAIVSARARNRKKWWCLLICIIILIIVAIVVAVVVTNGNNAKKVV